MSLLLSSSKYCDRRVVVVVVLSFGVIPCGVHRLSLSSFDHLLVLSVPLAHPVFLSFLHCFSSMSAPSQSSLPKQAEYREFRRSLLSALLEAEIEHGRNVAVMEDFLADLNDRVQTLSRRQRDDREHD